MEQNTNEWLEMRRTFIGASDVSAIMGISPFSTPLDIYRSKVGQPKKDKDKEWIFEAGHRLEQIARTKLNILLNLDFEPSIVRHPELPYCQVSLDGLDVKQEKQLEIKFLSADAFNNLKENGEVPYHYLPQLHYQMIATGIKETYFCGINEKEEISYTIVELCPEWVEKIIPAVEAFYYENMVKKIPPKVTDKDSLPIESSEVIKTLSQLKELQDQQKNIKQQIDHAKNLIIDAMSHSLMHCDLGTLKRSVTKNGDYSLTVRFK